MNQTGLNNEKSGILWEKDGDISVCLMKCSKYCYFLNTYNKFPEDAVLRLLLVLGTFRFEALLCLKEITGHVLFPRLLLVPGTFRFEALLCLKEITGHVLSPRLLLVLGTFRFEALLCLKEITGHVLFLRLLSCEQAVMDTIALYLCHAHTSVLLLSKEADFTARKYTIVLTIRNN